MRLAWRTGNKTVVAYGPQFAVIRSFMPRDEIKEFHVKYFNGTWTSGNIEEIGTKDRSRLFIRATRPTTNLSVYIFSLERNR